MRKFLYLTIGTIAVLLLGVCSLEAKTIAKDLYEDNDDDDDAIVGRSDNDDSSRGVNRTTTTSTSATTRTKTFDEILTDQNAKDEELWKTIQDLDNLEKLDTTSRSGANRDFNFNPIKSDVTFKTFDQMAADQKSYDELEKSLKDMDKINADLKTYNWNDYKAPEYTPTTTYYYNGVNGYHISGGFVAIALVLVFIRCCLICCRYQNQTRTRSIILVRETPVHALIIARHRRNSKEDLMGDVEPPADDPPSYEDCARDQNPMTLNTPTTTATATDSDRPVNSQ